MIDNRTAFFVFQTRENIYCYNTRTIPIEYYGLRCLKYLYLHLTLFKAVFRIGKKYLITAPVQFTERTTYDRSI